VDTYRLAPVGTWLTDAEEELIVLVMGLSKRFRKGAAGTPVGPLATSCLSGLLLTTGTSSISESSSSAMSMIEMFPSPDWVLEVLGLCPVESELEWFLGRLGDMSLTISF